MDKRLAVFLIRFPLLQFYFELKMQKSTFLKKNCFESSFFLLLLTFCLLLLPLRESVIVLCFVVCYFMSVLVLQSS